MKRLVEKAKEKTGKKVECAQCHDGVNDDRYDLLKKDAAKQLDALVALVGGA